MKKFLSVFLALLMVMLSIPMTAAAEDELKEGYYTYTVTDGEATITKVDNSITGDIVTPSTLGGYPVTQIGNDAFFYCFNLTGVTISEGVRIIGGGVFGNCHSLKTVIVPDSVEAVGMYAFSASTVTDIVLPDKELYIGYNAFQGTSYYDDTANWENGALYVGKHLVAVNGELKGDYSIKEGTLSIADEVFALFSGVTGIEIPDSVKRIGKNMFISCNNLEKVIIPDSVTDIEENAFSECPKLVIYCNEGSYAEEFANEHLLAYRIIGKVYPGDANGDGKINLTDVSTILKYIAKWDVTLDTAAADVTADGKVNLADASLILKYIAKWDVVLDKLNNRKRTHHEGFLKIMCPTLLLKFLRSFFQKATVTPLLACLFNSNGNSHGHTDHGVVTRADQSHLNLSSLRDCWRGEIGEGAVRLPPILLYCLLMMLSCYVIVVQLIF